MVGMELMRCSAPERFLLLYAKPAGWYSQAMRFTVDIDREDDGRWIAEVPDLPGVLVYGQTREEAVILAKALALRVLADRSRSSL